MNGFITAPREALHWIAWDLDGTLAETVLNEDGSHSRAIGSPIWINTIRVSNYHCRGWTNVLYTARPWSDVELIEQWLAHWHIPISRVIPGKVLFHTLIDDRAVSAFDHGYDPGYPDT